MSRQNQCGDRKRKDRDTHANVDLVLLVRVHGEGAGSSAVYFAQRFRRSPALCGTLFGVAQRTLPFGDESIDRLD